MPRAMVLWEPAALDPEELEGWAHQETRRLVRERVLLRADLVRLDGRPRVYGWMLDVEVPPEARWERGPLRDLLTDLRLLGARPVVLLPEAPQDGRAA